MDYWFFQRKR